MGLAVVPRLIFVIQLSQLVFAQPSATAPLGKKKTSDHSAKAERSQEPRMSKKTWTRRPWCVLCGSSIITTHTGPMSKAVSARHKPRLSDAMKEQIHAIKQSGNYGEVDDALLAPQKAVAPAALPPTVPPPAVVGPPSRFAANSHAALLLKSKQDESSVFSSITSVFAGDAHAKLEEQRRAERAEREQVRGLSLHSHEQMC